MTFTTFFINAILYSVQVILKICFAQMFYGIFFSFQLTDSYIYI